MANIKDLVQNPHPIFEKYRDYWKFLLDSWEGGFDYCKGDVSIDTSNSLKNWAFKIFAGSRELKSTTTGNLFIHQKETPADYKRRIAMSYYYNFCAPVIDIYTDHLFKQPIIEDFKEIKQAVEKRNENIDNKQSSIDEFRKEMAELSQLYGHVFVITDTVKSDAVVKTQADIFNNGLLPYFSLHHPQNIINWALDEFGHPYWVLILEAVDINVNPFVYNKDLIESRRFRLWTRDAWYLFNDKFDEIETGLHGLGYVPITCVFDKQSKKARNFLGISFIADIAYIARDIYNSCSELKQILRDQTFAFLAIQGNSTEYDELAIGTSKGLLYPQDRNIPQYVSPDSANAEVLFKHIDRQVNKIFQLAKLEGGSVQAPEQSAVEQSGVSKAWDFNQTNSALSKKASNLEDGEIKLWQIFAGWMGKTFTGSIQYPNEFSIKSLMEDLKEAEKMMKVNLGKEFQKEVNAAIIKKKFPRKSDKDIQILVDDMEKNIDEAEKVAKTEGNRLFDRIPSIKNKKQQNANFGGNKGAK